MNKMYNEKQNVQLETKCIMRKQNVPGVAAVQLSIMDAAPYAGMVAPTVVLVSGVVSVSKYTDTAFKSTDAPPALPNTSLAKSVQLVGCPCTVLPSLMPKPITCERADVATPGVTDTVNGDPGTGVGIAVPF